MRNLSLLVIPVVLLLTACAADAQDEHSALFDEADALAGWSIEGDAALDPARFHGDGGAALRVGPGASALWRLRDRDGGGKVTFRVYEDATQHEDEKQRSAGPLYGVITADGRVLAAGAVYAPYLKGNSTYALAEYVPGGEERPWFKVNYLGRERTPGWHEWVFDFDPAAGVTIYHNGQSLANRFQWATSQVKGFAGVVVLGDQGPGAPQTAWIDDVHVTLAGEMIDPIESMVPKTDPAIEGDAPAMVPELVGVHPRLLFGPEEVEELRAFAATPQGRLFMDRLVEYLGSSKPPANPAFLTDATDGQRQGLWRLPTVALHYLLTGDRESYNSAVGFLQMLLDLPHWETGELDSGMSSANIMAGAALAFDWLHDDLEPAFREAFRRKLWEHARRQYYIGHLKRGTGTHYWQNDPQNNHRWHRNAGMALATLAAYTGEESQQWMMQKLYDEMAYVVEWLPSDGTSHESPGYMIFGATHLTLGVQATDRCFGTDCLQRPFFANLPRFMLQTLTPGLDHRFHFGDQGGTETGPYNYDVFEMKAIGAHDQADLLPLVDRRLADDGIGVHIAWLGLLWYPRDLAPEPAATPLQGFFPDLGVQFVRDTWDAGGVGAMFKCGPFGGYLLNAYRRANDMGYINVAHDDPDANSFLLFDEGEFVAESDRYSAAKRSANLNTILINGIGQTVAGRPEGSVWWQPGGDMGEIAVITARAVSGRNLGIEGEAAGSYPANPREGKRPALDRYRRSFLWLDGRYVLVLDDIRAPEPVDIDWLIQSGAIDDAGDGRFVLAKGEATCPMQVAATVPLSASVVDSPADNKKKLLGWRQLRLRANAASVRLASIYDLWDRGELSVDLEPAGDDRAIVRVSGEGLADTWEWTAAGDRFAPSHLVGFDADGEELLTLSEPESETRTLIEQIRAIPGG